MNAQPPEDNSLPEGGPPENSGPPKSDLPAGAETAGSFEPATDELLSAYLDGETTEQQAQQIATDPELLGRVEQLRAASQQVAGPVFETRRAEIIAAAMAEYDQLYESAPGAEAAGVALESQATSGPSSSESKKSVFFHDTDDAGWESKKASFWRSPARGRALGVAALLVAGFLAFGMLQLVNRSADSDSFADTSAGLPDATISYSSVPDADESFATESAPAAEAAYDSASPATTVAEAPATPPAVAAATTTVITERLDVTVEASSNAGPSATVIIPPDFASQNEADCDDYNDPERLAATTTTSPPPTTTVAESGPGRDSAAATTTTSPPPPAPALDLGSGTDPGSGIPSTTIPPADSTTTAPPTTVPADDSDPASPAPPDIVLLGPPAASASFSC